MNTCQTPVERWLKRSTLKLAHTFLKKAEKKSARIFPKNESFIFCCNTRFFISSTFVRNTRLKFAKYQAIAKQHPEAELLLFEN